MKAVNLAAQAAVCSGGGSSLYQSHILSLASSLKPRSLLKTHGSGNYGESGSSAFYTLDQLPTVLESMTKLPSKYKAQLERVDLDLGPDRLAFYIDHVLSAQEADALAACAEAVLEANGHSRIAPGIRTPPGMRVNEAAHWYPPFGSQFLPSLYDRFCHLVPPTLPDDNGKDMPLYHKLSEKVAQFKYTKGDHFNRHIDGLFPGQGANAQGDGVDEWLGVVSGMSMLFYLNDQENDGLEGGETRLWSANGSKFVDVVPRKGRVLFFRRGSSNAVLHAGLEVTGDVPKYMALINLAYGEETGSRPMQSA